MEVFIEQVMGGESTRAMLEVRRQVFEREMGIRLAPEGAREGGRISHLLARVLPGGEAVGTLSVLDTSGDEQLHGGHRLDFEPGARAARFTHLAVLRPFRGRNLPVMLMLEAHRLFVAPRGYDYTWLLFDAARAPTSFLTRLLGFVPKADIFVSEYGRRCPLVRDEHAEGAAQALRRAELFLKQSEAPHAPAQATSAQCARGA